MRCDDCLDELPDIHFIVQDASEIEPDEWAEFDAKHLCADCAGWYRTAVLTEATV